MKIITGSSRSYTSLTMQIIKSLGYPVIGDKFINEKDKKFNPQGFYEVNKVVLKGLRENKYKNEAIKLITTALYPNGINKYTGTDEEILRDGEFLFLVRDPLETANSQSKVLGSDKISFDLIYYCWAFFLFWLRDNEWMIDKIVHYPTVHIFEDGEGYVEFLCKYLGINPQQKQKDKAASLIINKEEVELMEYDEEDEDKVETLYLIYEYLKKGDFNGAIGAVEERLAKRGL